ncbi:MAG: MATE family efflux transporter, partial [Vicinamibacteria bacterium]|nr:MATE family efflux transporter [Vicinamibacteria bacterium]
MEDLTTGSLSRHLMKTASFMLVTMVFQTLYFLVDLYWVGRLGKEAVAAVAIAGNLMFVVLAVTQMLGVGTTAMVSHAVGRKNRDTARHVFNQSQVLSVGVGLLFFALAMAARGTYARGLAADQITARLASDYLTWFIPAMSMQFALVAMGAALRGTGNFKPGMVVQTATVIINIVLAPVLMFGWGSGRPLGVAGAAIASLVAVTIGVAWLSRYFLKADAFLQFDQSAKTPDVALWKKLLGIGLPAGAEFGLMAVYLLIVYVISRPFGAAAQAGFGIGLRIVQALFMPVVALGFAVAPVAGQNFGAHKGARVRQTFREGAMMASGVMLVCGTICHLIPAPLIGIFSNDAEVIAVGSEYLRISSWNFIASGIIFVASSTFQALGNTLPALATSFMRILLVAIPAVIVSRWAGFELRWIWYLSVGATVFQMT